jgi:hypothetical protein
MSCPFDQDIKSEESANDNKEHRMGCVRCIACALPRTTNIDGSRFLFYFEMEQE